MLNIVFLKIVEKTLQVAFDDGELSTSFKALTIFGNLFDGFIDSFALILDVISEHV